MCLCGFEPVFVVLFHFGESECRDVLINCMCECLRLIYLSVSGIVYVIECVCVGLYKLLSNRGRANWYFYCIPSIACVDRDE